MLKKYKNALIDAIRERELNEGDFCPQEKEVDGNPAFILRLRQSPLFFLIRTSINNYHDLDCRYTTFSPGFSKTEYLPGEDWSTFSFVQGRFESWLENHVKEYLHELDAPDLWGQMEGQALFDVDPIGKTAPSEFDGAEKKRIRASLSRFRRLLEQEFAPTQEQLADIDEKLEYLSDALDRVNKIDWQGIAISTVIGISISLSLDTEKGRVLFELFRAAFRASLEHFK